jgi:RHS repeat-associated protein
VNLSRTYDGYGQLLTETVTAGGTTYANITQTWDAAGRRATLNDASSSLPALGSSNGPAPLFAYSHQADGLLTQVTANNQNYSFNYADNGLLTGRMNPFRSLSVDTRDAVGRILQQTQVVGLTPALVEAMAWRGNSTLNSYTATRAGTGAWNESRAYTYDARGQLLSEGFTAGSSLSPIASSLDYSFDGNNPGLGVRLDAKIGTGAPASWEIASSANSLGRVTTDNQLTAEGQAFSANGLAAGAGQVDILVDGVLQGLAAYSGGAWSLNLDLAAGAHTLTANAVDPSGLYTTSASSSFTVTAGNGSQPAGTVTSAYDGDGNVIGRSWDNGTTQTLSWDAFDRLIQVSQRDSSQNGYDWTAVYDGLGRRISTTLQPVANNIDTGTPTVTASEYDPQVEFLEIGVSVNGVKAWKVYGPDLNGRYGGLQGTGGLEATILDADGTTTGVLNDNFGNGVATISGGSVTWSPTKVGGYGPLPDSTAQPLTDATQVAQATVWRGHRIDPTGFYNLGARYYEPTSGRFLSPDPKGQAASMSLYDYANGDPVNNFDPDGRAGIGNIQGLSNTELNNRLTTVNLIINSTQNRIENSFAANSNNEQSDWGPVGDTLNLGAGGAGELAGAGQAAYDLSRTAAPVLLEPASQVLDGAAIVTSGMSAISAANNFYQGDNLSGYYNGASSLGGFASIGIAKAGPFGQLAAVVYGLGAQNIDFQYQLAMDQVDTEYLDEDYQLNKADINLLHEAEEYKIAIDQQLQNNETKQNCDN